MKKYLILVVGMVLVGVIGYYGWKWNNTQMNRPVNSTSTPQNGVKTVQISGVLMRNNPGLKENVWFLVYDEPGAPGLKAELSFSSGSECLRGQTGIDCAKLDLPNGTMATALGSKDGELLNVGRLNIEGPEEAVKVSSPSKNDRVTSPLQIEGSARGNWFFEASFPIRLIGMDGKSITTTHASARGDWMTKDFVPFSATLEFSVTTDTPAEMVFVADNPSGLPQFDKEYRLPVVLLPRSATRTIDLYFYDPEKDKDASGNILCSAKGLVRVRRTVSRTQNPLSDTIKALLAGPSESEKKSGATSEFPLRKVELKGAVIANGKATLTFSDPESELSGGSCRVAVLWAEIAATAKQFPGVREVKFDPPELFQP